MPAWLELDDVPESVPAMWSTVASHVQHCDPDLLLARAQLLGLPVAHVGESAGSRASSAHRLARPRRGPPAGPARRRPLGALGGPIVWRPPRPRRRQGRQGRIDTAARWRSLGPAEFFDLLNGRKQSVALHLRDRDGVRILHDLLRHADVVIEASRPRALAQLGVDGPDLVRTGGPQVWISITGHGRAGEAANRVAFGDDAAAAGGLVVWREGAPLFCADAIADPLTGLTAADACLRRAGRRRTLVAQCLHVSREHDLLRRRPCRSPELSVAPPQARPVEMPAPPFGADTARLLAELEIDP